MRRLAILTTLAGGVFVPLVLSACASIIQGTRQDVGISSHPSGATVSVNGRHLGQTPQVAKLERKDNHVVRIELPGYEPHELTLQRSVSGWVAGNIIFGGLIGLAVDAITGGMYKLSPEQLQTTLVQQSSMDHDGMKDGLAILVTLRPDPEWEQIGELDRK